ncbi:hypothetical protein SAMN05421739_104358 [Pontibacter chinhatensis]|uniref:Uncharacterized protein n=1 Tax=Pontibacter chinhatensis TaxID=1436961 RepID=A0A1I2VTE8_9BACT|nr:hypothetical protein SAMN05421739_104358 [Pontibacter chinhatensis]
MIPLLGGVGVGLHYHMKAIKPNLKYKNRKAPAAWAVGAFHVYRAGLGTVGNLVFLPLQCGDAGAGPGFHHSFIW